LGGVLLDKMRPEQAPLLFVVGGALTALSVVALMLSHQPVWLGMFMLSANAFWGLQGAAIPAVIQHHAAREAVGSAYGIINGIGNICAAFIPLLMGVVMKSVGSVSSGFSVWSCRRRSPCWPEECCCCACVAQQQSAPKAYSPFSPPECRAFPVPGSLPPGP
jgi:nitrate/nitrite transporter NarK